MLRSTTSQHTFIIVEVLFYVNVGNLMQQLIYNQKDIIDRGHNSIMQDL